jgi:hypothetical protein
VTVHDSQHLAHIRSLAIPDRLDADYADFIAKEVIFRG